STPSRRRSSTCAVPSMLDIRLIRAEPDRVKAELAKVGFSAAQLDELLAVDRRRREALHTVERLRAERTTASKAIRDLGDAVERERAIAAQRGVGEQIAAAETEAVVDEEEYGRLMLEVPNLPHPDVPVGPDESANVVVRTEGALPTFDFTVRPHWEIGPELGILDFERGVKISGTRFYVLRGAGARLQRGLITWMLDLHTREHGYTEVYPPEMVKFVAPETSDQELVRLLADAEDVCRRLGLPYRIVQMCTGDLSFTAAMKYDIEVWAPGCGEWLEVSSCSNFRDFQARRANIRYRPAPRAKPELVHTLNGSGLALPRVMIALLETYQRADGSVAVPEVLRPYVGADVIARGEPT